jgi:hypothetical protein
MNEELEILGALYPNLSPEELMAARDNLDRYLSLAWEIFEESQLLPQSSPEGHLAVGSKGKVDSPKKLTIHQISETVSRVHQSLNRSPRRAKRIST